MRDDVGSIETDGKTVVDGDTVGSFFGKVDSSPFFNFEVFFNSLFLLSPISIIPFLFILYDDVGSVETDGKNVVDGDTVGSGVEILDSSVLLCLDDFFIFFTFLFSDVFFICFCDEVGGCVNAVGTLLMSLVAGTEVTVAIILTGRLVVVVVDVTINVGTAVIVDAEDGASDRTGAIVEFFLRLFFFVFEFFIVIFGETLLLLILLIVFELFRFFFTDGDGGIDEGSSELALSKNDALPRLRWRLKICSTEFFERLSIRSITSAEGKIPVRTGTSPFFTLEDDSLEVELLPEVVDRDVVNI